MGGGLKRPPPPRDPSIALGKTNGADQTIRLSIYDQLGPISDFYDQSVPISDCICQFVSTLSTPSSPPLVGGGWQALINSFIFRSYDIIYHLNLGRYECCDICVYNVDSTCFLYMLYSNRTSILLGKCLNLYLLASR